MPKKSAKPKAAAASNNAAASSNAASSLESRISGLSIQVPNSNGNAIINPATGLPFNANHQNSSAAVSEPASVNRNVQHQVPAELSVIAPRSGKEEAVNHRTHAIANGNANRNANRNAVSSSSSSSFLSTAASSADANHNANHHANHNANRNIVASSSAAASEPVAVSMLRPVSGPLKTDAEIDATIIHPHHLELKNDWSETFKNDGLVPYCDVCGRRGMSSTYRCHGINCVYDECETCHSASHLRIRQQLPNSILPVFKIASDTEIINKLSLTPHRNDTMIAELRLREWKPNEIRRCDICHRLTLKSYYCEDHNYDECVYCRTIFSGKQAHKNQFMTLQRQMNTKRQVNKNKVNRQYQQRIAQLGRGRHSKRNTHRKKAHRRTHKRSARR